jgi:chemotaxis protein CheX
LADFELASGDARRLDGEVSVQPLESFVTATLVAFAEMACTEVAVHEIYRATLEDTWGDISAVLGIKSATEGILVLSFPERTAAAIADRVLAGVSVEINDTLIRDCMGEIANVIAGQAKTLLAGTPHELTFSLPQVVVGDSLGSGPKQSHGCLVIAFCCDVGEFTMRLDLER